MTVQGIAGSIKVPVALPFRLDQLGNANGTMQTAQGTVNEYAMPVGGSVIGYSVNLDGTLTTGTLTFNATKNGALITNSFSNNPLTVQHAYETDVAQPGLSFNAGDTIGLMWTKAGTVAPTTRNMVALVFVLLDKYDY